MIKDDSFSKDWIHDLRTDKEYKRADPELMQKMIYALYLVEQLKISGLDFIFRGGTCLSLLIPGIRRFSIDVDILIKKDEKRIDEFLSRIIRFSRFERFELDTRRSFKDGIPKAHYYFYFNSELDNSEKYILLDVLYDSDPFKHLVSLPVLSNILNTDSTQPVTILIPSINDIAADKLTAFAPNTIGIPYKKGKSLQIIKQAFDIGYLYDYVDDLESMNETYIKIAQTQCRFCGTEFTVSDSLTDTVNTAYILALQDNKDLTDGYSELIKGIKAFPSFLPASRFNLYNAIEITSKVALLAAKLKMSSFETLPTISTSGYNPKDYPFSQGIYFPIAKRVKHLPNLSHFYWYHIAKLLH